MGRQSRRRSNPSQATRAPQSSPPPRSPVADPVPPPAHLSTTGSRRDLEIAVALAVVTLILYWPAHGFDFIQLDDMEYVHSNAPVRAGLTLDSIKWAFTTLLGSFWMPVLWLSFMFDSTFYGPDAGGYHVTNVLLHAASTVVMFELLRRATGRRWPSAFVAALFAVHPLHVESVAWIIERKDTLSTLFLLLTLWAYGAYAAQPTGQRYALTLLLFVLGMMAKPMLMTMPILLLAIDLWPLNRFEGMPPRRLLLEKVPFLVLAVPPAFIAMASGHHLDDGPTIGLGVLAGRAAMACEAYVLYLVKMVWPSGLAVLYPQYDVPVWRSSLAALLLVAITAAALGLARRRPYVTAGWLWFVVSLLPVSGLVRTGEYAMADRFTYVSLLGIFVIVAWGASELIATRRQQTIAAVLGGAALLALTVVARIQLGYWQNGVTLFERTLAVTSDDNFVIQYVLGLAYAQAGRGDDAITRFNAALRLKPGYANAHASLAQLLAERGDTDEAKAHYEMALSVAPDEGFALVNLGNMMMGEKRYAEAMTQYSSALRANPDNAEAHTGYGRALAEQGRIAEAITHYTTALRLRPENPEAHNNLANALVGQGQDAEAQRHYEAAVRLRPAYEQAQSNFGIFLAERGRFAEAAEHFAAAVKLNPGDANTQSNLGNALAAQGKFEDAVGPFTESVRLDPNSASNQNNLANVFATLGRVDDSLSHYQAALQIEPGYAEAHFNMAMVLAEHDRAAEAIGHYGEAIRLKPDYAAAHAQLGLLLRAQGKLDEATKHFQEALRLDPNDPVARRELAAQ